MPYSKISINLNIVRRIFRNNLGVIEFNLGNLEKAEEIFKELLKYNGKSDVVVWMNLALLYWTQEKIDDAVKCIKQLYAIDNKSWIWMDELS